MGVQDRGWMTMPLSDDPEKRDDSADVLRDGTPLEPARPPETPPAPGVDHRLYAPWPEGWSAHIKTNWDKDYCFSKNAGEDYFHLLQNGELYVQRGIERYCLNCALKLHILTEDRIHWQRRSDHPPPQIANDL